MLSRSVIGSLRPSLLAVLTLAAPVSFAQIPSTIAEQLTTQERIERSKWWPTGGKATREQYLGPQSCAFCHNALVRTQAQHSMATTSLKSENSQILNANAESEFHLGEYRYKISREPNGAFHYAVAGPGTSISVPIQWAFGAGKVGQSYLANEKGRFREVRFSYFSSLQGFDVTPNQSQELPSSIDKAAGRLLEDAEAQRCFGCHTTASTSGHHFQPENAIAGVSCEACHGPGSQHVAAMKAGNLNVGRASINNPGQLNPIELVDFCGACHTTWWDAKRIAAAGVANIRFHPYRLESSRCWGKGDSRLTCPACHNPHQPLVREAGAYDVRCLSCHLNSKQAKPMPGHPGLPCPVSEKDCVACHMPKYEVPDMHYPYTDHRIRIVRKGESFPD